MTTKIKTNENTKNKDKFVYVLTSQKCPHFNVKNLWPHFVQKQEYTHTQYDNVWSTDSVLSQSDDTVIILKLYLWCVCVWGGGVCVDKVIWIEWSLGLRSLIYLMDGYVPSSWCLCGRTEDSLFGPVHKKTHPGSENRPVGFLSELTLSRLKNKPMVDNRALSSGSDGRMLCWLRSNLQKSRVWLRFFTVLF